jgi:hypothetical protein
MCYKTDSSGTSRRRDTSYRRTRPLAKSVYVRGTPDNEGEKRAPRKHQETTGQIATDAGRKSVSRQIYDKEIVAIFRVDPGVVYVNGVEAR